MNPEHKSRPTLLLTLIAPVIGAYLGTFLVSALRTAYYIARDIQPDMSPMMFVMFSPIVGTGVAIVALLGEAILSRVWIRPRSFFHALTLGATYSSLLMFLVEPWLALLCLFINPAVIRILWPTKPPTG